MRLELSPEDAAFREEMRTFFTTAVPQEIRDAVAARRELTKDQIVESQRILNEHGLAVPNWPVEWGGQDWTPLQRHIWHEEMQRACVPLPLAFNASMVGPVIAAFGSQEQKERFLPATANLDIWWSQGFSEPDAGSDLAGILTLRQGLDAVGVQLLVIAPAGGKLAGDGLEAIDLADVGRAFDHAVVHALERIVAARHPRVVGQDATTLTLGIVVVDAQGRVAAALRFDPSYVELAGVDAALLDVLAGKAKPEGKLPFELPSSMETVRKQKEDLPYDYMKNQIAFLVGPFTARQP